MYIISLSDRHLIFGVSTDVKSIQSPTGSIFREQDTDKAFRLEGGIWVEKLNPSYSVAAHTHVPVPPTYALLANGATTMGLGTNNTAKVTPTATATYTTTAPVAGTHCHLIILTAGTTSFTITFGTGFKPATTLVTGTVAARVFVLSWISDGTNLYEVSRTAAIIA